MLVGLTGQIGSGKTTAANILKSFGAIIIDADLIGRQVVDQSEPLRHALASDFGPEILTPTGRLRRKLLASYAFATLKSKAKLDRLVHPHLIRELYRRTRIAQRKNRIVIIDAALLLDWKLDRIVDFVLIIHTSKTRRINWLLKRGMSRTDVHLRQKSQLPFAEYRLRGDLVILNSGTKTQLKVRLSRLWDDWRKRD